MKIVKDYFKITIRSLLKFKAQNFVSVLGVSIGLVLSILALYWFKYETSFDAQIKDSDRIYQVITKSTGGSRFAMCKFRYRLLDEMFQNIPEIEAHCYGSENVNLYSTEKNPELEVMTSLLQVNVPFFSLLDIQFLKGEKPELFEPGADVVILTESIARKLFGRTDIINEKVKNVWNGLDYLVVGVVKDNPANSNIRYGGLTPFAKNREGDYYSYVLLNKNANKESVVSKLNEEAIKKEEQQMDLVPLQQSKYLVSGDSFLKAYSFLIVVVVSSLFLLLCTFVNLYVITLTKFMQRIRECAFHRQVGASTVHIYGLFYLEIFILLIVSFLLCFILIELFYGPFYNMTHVPLSGKEFYFFVMKVSLLFFALLLLLQGFVVHYISDLSKFKNRFSRFFIGKKNRNVLFVQLLISGVFVFVLTVVYLQFRYMLEAPLGFKNDNVVYIRLDQRLKKNNEALINDLKAGSMIKDAISQSFVIFNDQEGTISAEYFEELDGVNKNAQLAKVMVSEKTAPFFEFKISAGRFLKDNQFPAEVMLNEEAVSVLGLTEPIGKIFKGYGTSFVIVGVVKNYISKPMSSSISPMLYTPYSIMKSYVPYTAYVKYEPGMRIEALKYIDKVCGRYSVGYNKDETIRPMDTYIRSFYQKEIVVLNILSVTTITCLLITIWGILGVVSYTLKQQRKAIAIRKVMGAERSTILKMYLEQYGILSLLASFFSVLISYTFVKNWLSFYAYRIELNLPIFLNVFVILLSVVLFITFLLVNKTIVENPADVVKENN